jgi:hypothetical protein
VTQFAPTKKRSRLAAAAPFSFALIAPVQARKIPSLEQDDQKDDQENETADTDIHRFAPTVFGSGSVTIAAFAKFRRIAAISSR